MKKILMALVLVLMVNVSYAENTPTPTPQIIKGTYSQSPSTFVAAALRSPIQLNWVNGNQAIVNGFVEFGMPAAIGTPSDTTSDASYVTVTVRGSGAGATYNPASILKSGGKIKVPILTMAPGSAYGVVVKIGPADLTPVATYAAGNLTWTFNGLVAGLTPVATFSTNKVMAVVTVTLTPTATAAPTAQPTKTPIPSTVKDKITAVTAGYQLSGPGYLKGVGITSRTALGSLKFSDSENVGRIGTNGKYFEISPTAAELEDGIQFYPLTSVDNKGIWFSKGICVYTGVSQTSENNNTINAYFIQ